MYLLDIILLLAITSTLVLYISIIIKIIIVETSWPISKSTKEAFTAAIKWPYTFGRDMVGVIKNRIKDKGFGG